MTREEFFEWLDTCPTNKWEVVQDDVGCVWISFRNDELEGTTSLFLNRFIGENDYVEENKE